MLGITMNKFTHFNEKTVVSNELNFLSLVKSPKKSYQFKLKIGKGY